MCDGSIALARHSLVASSISASVTPSICFNFSSVSSGMLPVAKNCSCARLISELASSGGAPVISLSSSVPSSSSISALVDSSVIVVVLVVVLNLQLSSGLPLKPLDFLMLVLLRQQLVEVFLTLSSSQWSDDFPTRLSSRMG